VHLLGKNPDGTTRKENQIRARKDYFSLHPKGQARWSPKSHTTTKGRARTGIINRNWLVPTREALAKLSQNSLHIYQKNNTICQEIKRKDQQEECPPASSDRRRNKIEWDGVSWEPNKRPRPGGLDEILE